MIEYFFRRSFIGTNDLRKNGSSVGIKIPNIFTLRQLFEENVIESMGFTFLTTYGVLIMLC